MALLGLPGFPIATNHQRETFVNYWDNAWWENAWQQLGDERADLLWNVFDTIRFFEVVEAELEE